MAGIDFLKVAKAFEKKGDSSANSEIKSDYYRKAGDYYKNALKTDDANRLYNLAMDSSKYPSTRRTIEGLLKNLKKPSYNEILNPSLKTEAILSILSLLVSLFFVASNLTGNTIAELSQNNLRFVGTCFFACGLIFAFIYLRSRSKVKSKIKGRKRK
jgi:hypothetical protein